MAKVAKHYLWMSGRKGKVIKAFTTNTFNINPAPIPRKFSGVFRVNTAQAKGRNVYTVVPKGHPSGKYILYLHGGAYISNLVSQHWDLIGELVRRTNRTVVVPDYPLAPTYTVADVIPMVEAVYENLLTNTSPDNIVFMGDSAGAGLILTFAQKLKTEGGHQPQQLILLSPWLDVTMTNPGIRALEQKDPMLSVAGLVMAGKAYAGKLDAKNYLVSPIYGSLEGLAKISVFIGGDEVLNADCRKFKSLLAQQGVAINYIEYPDMFHVWGAATFLKEAKCALDQITQLIA